MVSKIRSLFECDADLDGVKDRGFPKHCFESSHSSKYVFDLSMRQVISKEMNSERRVTYLYLADDSVAIFSFLQNALRAPESLT
jgi:hypothetical protein